MQEISYGLNDTWSATRLVTWSSTVSNSTCLLVLPPCYILQNKLKDLSRKLKQGMSLGLNDFNCGVLQGSLLGPLLFLIHLVCQCYHLVIFFESKNLIRGLMHLSLHSIRRKIKQQKKAQPFLLPSATLKKARQLILPSDIQHLPTKFLKPS